MERGNLVFEIKRERLLHPESFRDDKLMYYSTTKIWFDDLGFEINSKVLD